MLRGWDEIGAFCGYKRQTLWRWRKEHAGAEALPVTERDGSVIAEESAIRAWCLKHGKTKKHRPSTLEELASANAGEIEVPAPPLPTCENEFDSFIDPELFASYPEPTGNLEDELAQARKLRYRFGAIVSAWRLDTLANPKTARTYRDFAAELVRQIAVIGRLEEALVKQRMRLGNLLEEETVLACMEKLGGNVVDRFAGLVEKVFGVLAGEVAKTAAAASVDLPLDSDKIKALLRQVFDAERTEIGQEALKVLAGEQAEQAERLGVKDGGDNAAALQGASA